MWTKRQSQEEARSKEGAKSKKEIGWNRTLEETGDIFWGVGIGYVLSLFEWNAVKNAVKKST
jgi:hypothetical protein